MKIEILEDLDFPKLGRFYKKGEIEVSEKEAQILLTSPYVTINKQNNGFSERKYSLEQEQADVGKGKTAPKKNKSR